MFEYILFLMLCCHFPRVGQSETDYFAHCLCTQLTEKVNPALRPFIQKFWSYSNYPLSLGLSDYCAHDVDGNTPSTGIHFPYVLILKPVRKADVRITSGPNVSAASSTPDCSAACPHVHTHAHAKKETKKNHTKPDVEQFDTFLEDVEGIQPGTILFDLFSCPEPKAALDPARLQRIGRIITTSDAIPSLPDDNLFFRHQKKEEDFALRPEWKQAVKMKCSVGEAQIASKKYVDFDTA